MTVSAASAASDRRSILKQRHRRAIIDAAAALMSEQGMSFSVDELAARADVARRTVFNHFNSLDEVIVEACSELLGSTLDELVSLMKHGTEVPGSMADQVIAALRRSDVVGPMARLTAMLGDDGGQLGDARPSPRSALIALRSFTAITRRMSEELRLGYPDADPLDVDLFSGAFIGGLAVLYQHWSAATGAVDTRESREAWTRLREQFLTALQSGHGTTACSRTFPVSPTPDGKSPLG